MSLKDFELYQLSLKFLHLAHNHAEQLPRGYAELREQLKRASLSIVLNVAEGAGKFSKAEQKRYYGIARGSAFECYAAIEAAHVLDLEKSTSLRDAIDLIDRIISVLTKLCTK